jgi:hypothetical protein
MSVEIRNVVHVSGLIHSITKNWRMCVRADGQRQRRNSIVSRKITSTPCDSTRLTITDTHTNNAAAIIIIIIYNFEFRNS